MQHTFQTTALTLLLGISALLTPLPAWTQILGLLVDPAADQIEPDSYWGRTIAFAQAVSDNLGGELRVLHAKGNPADALKVLHQAALGTSPVDGLLLYDAGELAVSMAVVCEKARIPYVFYADPPPDDVFRQIQPPPSFRVASVMPDWKAAAGETIDRLLAEAKKGKVDGGPIQVCGIGGREKGMAFKQVRDECRERTEAAGEEWKQLVYCNGGDEVAHKKTMALLHRYPGCRVFWTGREETTRGALKALRERERMPGQDVFVSGVTLTQAHLKELKEGALSLCVAGDVLSAGWAAIVLHDQIRAFQHVKFPPVITYPLYSVTADEADSYSWLSSPAAWEQIDFSLFSQGSGADRSSYNFDLRRALPAAAP